MIINGIIWVRGKDGEAGVDNFPIFLQNDDRVEAPFREPPEFLTVAPLQHGSIPGRILIPKDNAISSPISHIETPLNV